MPAILVVGLLLLFPVATSFYYSFTSKHLIKPSYEFIGFSNYITILTDTAFWKAFITNIKWTFISLTFQILVGFTAALALERIKHFKGLFRTLLIIPWAFPTIVIALSWKWILNGVSGYFPNLLVEIGLLENIPQFLSSADLVFLTVVFINVWFGSPLIMVNVLSALQTVPKDQYEAAEIDGASSWKTFIKITLPNIRIVIVLLIVLRTIWIFNSFDMIYLLTGGGPAGLTQIVPIYAYNLGWGLKQIGQSSAVTVLMLIFLLLISSLYFRFLNKWERGGT